MTLALDDLGSGDIRTVIVTSSDVSGRLVGKRFSPDVFRRLVEEGVALSSCVLGWDVDQWPGPQQAYTGHQTGWHDVRLVPDLATLRPAAWLDRTAICVADFVEMARDDLVAVAPRIGGYVVAAWLAGIIVNLLLIGDFYDVALRDFGLLVGALALARLAPPSSLRGRRARTS